jgi:hypothetical protein
MDLPNLKTAKREGEGSAHMLLIQTAKNDEVIDNRRIEVADASGDVLEVCRLKDPIN